MGTQSPIIQRPLGQLHTEWLREASRAAAAGFEAVQAFGQVAHERVSLDTMPGPPSDWDPEVDRMDYGEAECSVTVQAWQDDKKEEDERHGED